MITRRDLFKVAALAPAAALQAQSATRPNILIIMADQQQAGLTRRSGFPLDTMPTLDRLAARGVAFDRAYTTAPLCVPARISLLTGRWPHAHRVLQNSAGKHAVFEKDLFQVAKFLGYKTGLSGKNHSYLTPEKLDFWRPFMHLGGYQAPNAPRTDAEFDRWLEHLNHGTATEATPFPAEAQLPYRIVSSAMEFIDSSGRDPFALWVSFPEPHNPYQVPKPYFDMFPPDSVPARHVGPEALSSQGQKWGFLQRLEESTYPGYDQQWRRMKSNYLGMLRLIDDQLARLTKHLEQRGILDNTIIVYLSDHGDFLGEYGLIRKGVELPEVLTRIPMVWSGPGIRARRDPPEFVSTADIMPTLCEALGQEIPFGAQGRSLWPMLRGEAYPREEFRSIYAEVGFGGLHHEPSDPTPPRTGRVPGAKDAIPTFDELNSYTQSGRLKMVRMGDWKLTFDMMGTGRLYNLKADPFELRDLYGTPGAANMQAQLMAELLTWTIRTQDDLPQAAYQSKRAPHNWYWPYRPAAK